MTGLEDGYSMVESHPDDGNDASEKEGLLYEWGGNNDRTNAQNQRKTRRLNTRNVIFALIGIAVLLAATIYLILSGQINSHGIQTSVQTPDYILDLKWDANAAPQRREYFWKIKDTIHNPDGVSRPMMLVNNQFPGPLIEANEGDTIVVHVDNHAINATSIHWHGIYQNGTPHMDGTVGVTQCPIAPGKKFVYEFTVSGQSGTYWWHSHQGVQSSDGLHGPLVIHGRNEKRLQQAEYATDRVILVSDHYHDLSSALLWQYLKPDMENAEPVPNGAVINGRAVRNCDDFAERKCDNTTSSLATFDLQSNKGHRLRFINTGAFAEFQVQVDEHDLMVTEVDGTDVLPTRYHRLNISPAQRYSVVINTDVAEAESFWLRARMVTQCFTDPPPDLQSEVRGIVRYTSDSAESNAKPESRDWNEILLDECKDMNSSELVPAETLAPPVQPDTFFYLRSNFEIGAYRLSRGLFNSSSWRPDVRSPTLQRALEGIQSKDVAFSTEISDQAFVNDRAFDTSRELVVQTSDIQTIDILVSNFDDGDHPLHLHGYKYWVLAQGTGYPALTHVGADINLQTLAPLYESLNLTNPLRRDTASVQAFGWTLLRFVADNPGAWAFHCHLSWHSEAGLMMQFLTRTNELDGTHIPDVNSRLCQAEGVEKGSGPEDEDYRDLAR